MNLQGTFNALRLAAARMAGARGRRRAGRVRADDLDRGVGGPDRTDLLCRLEGRDVGMTLVAARDLASRLIRVCAIAPGIFDTPMLARLPENVRRRSAPRFRTRSSRRARGVRLARARDRRQPDAQRRDDQLDGALRRRPMSAAGFQGRPRPAVRGVAVVELAGLGPPSTAPACLRPRGVGDPARPPGRRRPAQRRRRAPPASSREGGARSRSTSSPPPAASSPSR